MKVSSKIILGFLVLMVLAGIVVANQLSAIRQMQRANQDVSEIDVTSAKIVLEIQKLAELIKEDSEKYFALGDPAGYERQLADLRSDFLDALNRLRPNAKSEREQAEVAKLQKAFDDFWLVFNRLKQVKQTWDPDQLPKDLVVAENELITQPSVLLDAVQAAIKDRVEAAAAVGSKAERLSWTAGIFAFALGVIVAWLIVRSINDPLRRLTQGTRAIAKGQFWHRLP